jgi:hypothetical protein
MSRTMLHGIPSLLLLSVMYTLLASGQIRIGVHGGVNLSDVTEPPDYDHVGTWEMQTYGFGGIMADVLLAEHWQLAAEVNFIQKGIRIPNVAWGLPWQGTTTLTANYYEVPLKIRYRSSGRPFGWFVEGGTALALLESGRAHEVMLPGGGMPYREETSEVGGMYRKYQTSLVAGVGAEYEVTGAMTLVLSGSYSFGLSDAYDRFWADAKSRGIRLDVGVLVSL